MAPMSSPPGPDRAGLAGSVIPERPDARAAHPIPRPSAGTDSTRDVAQEDFLFHLYRGSELLQENRVLEAKEELEFALTMQPLDPKGQDLLGAVYFRVGLYPRAIQIYEGLAAQFPRDVSVRINLALCYLKTGQPEPARRTLQDVVQLNPEHKRAWGYLGLALQNLGELEPAQIAFERGGHAMMAQRVIDRRRRSARPPPSESPPSEIDEGVRSVAEMAFSELDAGELRFSLAEPESSRAGDGQWHTLELGDATASKYPSPPASLRSAQPAVKFPTLQSPRPVPGPLDDGSRGDPPPLVAPLDRNVALHANDVLLVRVEDGQSFAARLDALRAIGGTQSTRALHRRLRDAETNEVLGGIGSPLVRVTGPAQLVLGSRSSRQIALLSLDDQLAFVREDVLLGFELQLTYENGRVALEPEGGGARPSSDSVPVVQLRGQGALALEVGGKLASLPSLAGRPLLVRREWVVGWLGRLVCRALPAGDSPNGQRGLVTFSGEGTVLVATG
jgi:uncharacterized protein (AIM24 family)